VDKQHADIREQHEVSEEQYRELSDKGAEVARVASALGTTFEVALALVTIDLLKERARRLGHHARELRNAAHQAEVRTRRALRRGGVQADHEEIEAWIERVVGLVTPMGEVESAHEQLLAELEAFCTEQ